MAFAGMPGNAPGRDAGRFVTPAMAHFVAKSNIVS
jgi:hypothetical protein